VPERRNNVASHPNSITRPHAEPTHDLEFRDPTPCRRKLGTDVRCRRFPTSLPRSAKGHEDAFPRPRLSARCPFSQGTFAGTRGNGRDAPEAAVRRMTTHRPETTHTPPLVPGAPHVSFRASYLPGRLAFRQRAGLRPDQAVEQIRIHENKLAEIDYMISECGGPELIGRAFRVLQQILPLRRQIYHFYFTRGLCVYQQAYIVAALNICAATR
jgi:hypothetical protein